MIEQGLLKQNFIGKDGFVWWIGQIAPQSTWVKNAPATDIATVQEERGFGQRYKVRIMGYHTARTEDLPDDQLPWATVLYPITAGGGGKNCTQSANLSQGTFVFGFFLDGNDGQQPVIMGCLGYNDYNAVLKNIPNANFIPFSGYEPSDMIPIGAQRTTGATTELPRTGSQQTTTEGKVNNYSTESAQVGLGLKTKIESEGTGKCSPDRRPSPIAKPSSQDPLPMGRLQKQIRKAIQDIQDLQKTIYSISCKGTRGLSNIQKQINKAIKEATKFISSSMKTVYNTISEKVLTTLNDAAKAILSWIPVTYRTAAEEVVLLSADNLACLFKRLIATLLKQIRGFIMDAVNRVINVPRCFVDQFIANFLAVTKAGISGIVGALQESLTSLADAAMGALDIVGDVLGVIDDILSFLTCDTKPKESTIEEWSILSGESLVSKADIDNIIDRAKNLGSQFERAGDFTNIEDALSDVDFSNVFDVSNCDTSAILCGPPIVQFLGSSGAGARANLIIGSLGEVIGVDILSFGDGNYSRDTRAIVHDPCGKGVGARLAIRWKNYYGTGTGTGVGDGTGTVGEFDIVVTDPGTDYLPSPDGSRGGDGRTWAQVDDTTIDHPDGTFEVPIPPGWDVQVEVGDTVQLPPGRCVVTEPYEEELCGRSVAQYSGKFTTPSADYDALRGKYPSVGDGSYPVILSLCEIIIVDGGLEYQEGDEIVIEPNAGAVAIPKIDKFGRVIGVKVTNPGEGFQDYPSIYIKSDTGYNAELLPKFCIDRISSDKVQEVGTQRVINVVDCVGSV